MRFLSLIILIVAACTPKGPHRPVNEQGPVRAKGSVSYNQVRPIFAQNCAACHPSRSGPDWLDYNAAKRYALNGTLVRKVSSERSMPPPGSPQAAAMSDSDRQLLSAWSRDGAPEREVIEANNELASTSNQLFQRCTQCHGPQGPTAQAQPKIPRINGQNYLYLVNQLQEFKWRRRVDPTDTMNDITSDLSDVQIESIAGYFASQSGLAVDEPPKEMTLHQQLLVAHGRDLAAKDNLNCLSCHMDPQPADPALPKLAGQSEQYLRNQLIYYRMEERKNPLMNEFTRALSDRDIEALALYFSRGQP